jgi:tyrosinase
VLALTPFHRNAAGNLWTSTAARDIRSQGYTYPELLNNPSNATLVASIKAQYSGPSNVSVTSTRRRAQAKRQSSSPTTKEKTLYLAEVQLPIYGLDDGNGGASAYSVLLFVGDVSDDASKWSTSESLVGTAASLGGVHLQGDQVVPSTIDLSLALERAIAAGKTTSESAEEYLKANLKHRVELVSTSDMKVIFAGGTDNTQGGAEIPKTAVANLQVGLISTRVEIAQSDEEFDRWVGGFVQHGTVDA